MLQKMSYQHLDQIIAIHESSWGDYEISPKLGTEYLHLFYSNVISSEYSFGYVYASDGKVVAYAVGYYDYQAFRKFVLRRMGYRFGIILLKCLFKRTIGLSDIVDLIIDKKKLRNAKYPKHHLGALALSKEYKGTPYGGEAIKETILAVLKQLKDKNCHGVWGCIYVQNIPMKKYLLKLGFEEADTTKFINKSVILFEKSLNDT